MLGTEALQVPLILLLMILILILLRRGNRKADQEQDQEQEQESDYLRLAFLAHQILHRLAAADKGEAVRPAPAPPPGADGNCNSKP